MYGLVLSGSGREAVGGRRPASCPAARSGAAAPQKFPLVGKARANEQQTLVDFVVPFRLVYCAVLGSGADVDQDHEHAGGEDEPQGDVRPIPVPWRVGHGFTDQQLCSMVRKLSVR
jgi:hypothetical protein